MDVATRYGALPRAPHARVVALAARHRHGGVDGPGVRRTVHTDGRLGVRCSERGAVRGACCSPSPPPSRSGGHELRAGRAHIDVELAAAASGARPRAGRATARSRCRQPRMDAAAGVGPDGGSRRPRRPARPDAVLVRVDAPPRRPRRPRSNTSAARTARAGCAHERHDCRRRDHRPTASFADRRRRRRPRRASRRCWCSAWGSSRPAVARKVIAVAWKASTGRTPPGTDDTERSLPVVLLWGAAAGAAVGAARICSPSVRPTPSRSVARPDPAAGHGRSQTRRVRVPNPPSPSPSGPASDPPPMRRRRSSARTCSPIASVARRFSTAPATPAPTRIPLRPSALPAMAADARRVVGRRAICDSVATRPPASEISSPR